jgi:simple sugar transport system ATP-binding protein
VAILAVEGLTKGFGTVTALDDVSLDVCAGEIHALVGENGSGKSTLCRVLSGDPLIAQTGGYRGRILLDGSEVSIASPAQALAAGIGLVHQELSLVAQMTIAENIVLGREPTRGVAPLSGIDHRSANTTASDALNMLGVAMDPRRVVGELPIGMQQLVEAARELSRAGLRVLILDEPSAALSKRESETLATMMRAAADAGVAVLFISHRLTEVLDVSDRITVLRDGGVAGAFARGETDAVELARLMLGEETGEVISRGPVGVREPVLSIDGLRVAMPGDPLRDLSLTVGRGEIVGVTAQAGHGRLAVAGGLLGLYPAQGSIAVGDARLTPGDVVALEDAGVSVVHEDRRNVGLDPSASIELNIALPSMLAGRRFVRALWLPGGGFPDAGAMRDAAIELIERLSIKCESPDQAVGELSGGNQQKVAIARAVVSRPAALIVAEPTRGIDVRAKEVVLRTLVSIADEGVGVVVVSGEIAELERVCDRVVVLRNGRKSAEFRSPLQAVEIELAVQGASLQGISA